MARGKKSKAEGIIKNSEKENPVDFIAVKDGDTEYSAKTVEAQSKTKLEDDPGQGGVITVRFFTYAANPETFKKYEVTAQNLFNCHAKQIDIELWKDGWQPVLEVDPRFLFSTDGIKFEPYSPQGKQYSHYQIVITAKPARGNIVSYREQPKRLADFVHGHTSENRD